MKALLQHGPLAGQETDLPVALAPGSVLLVPYPRCLVPEQCDCVRLPSMLGILEYRAGEVIGAFQLFYFDNERLAA